ncbi:hypothetical protein CDL12_16122 [Handroanthus impetiginosus]|uniref:Uncharacterized protein n=1 Tax=Handroanthus impetiginosus TaxID=429701 RepID=A0A2G9H1W0_9LAMI|nr:hypothetical protein CDL12_16122 [Handroanthus impetiginosus]
MMKIICWCILVILMFFVPNGIISFYSELCFWALILIVHLRLLLPFHFSITVLHCLHINHQDKGKNHWCDFR